MGLFAMKLLAIVSAICLASKMQDSMDDGSNQGSLQPTAAPRSPYDIMTEGALQCQNNQFLQMQCMALATYDAIKARVHAILTTLDGLGICNSQSCPRADFAGCVLRMAGHDFMDMRWDPNASANPTGGSDGCVSFLDPDNAGLAPCLTGQSYLHANLNAADTGLASVYHDFCSQASLADFFVIAAEAVMGYTRRMAVAPNDASFDPGFRSRFKFGRVTSTRCDYAAGRMPNPEHGCSATREVFLDNLLLDWRGAAALMGVHTLGRVHIGNSGYHGWWSDPVNSSLFNNNYYVSMVVKPWKPRPVYRSASTMSRLPSGTPTGKFQWDIHPRMCQGQVDCDQKHLTASNEMMLNTDICLLYSDLRADQAVSEDGEGGCCQWAMPNEFLPLFYQVNQNWCASGPNQLLHPRFEFNNVHRKCCTSEVTCDFADSPGGPAKEFVKEFAENDTLWFETFKDVWARATEVHMPAAGGGTVLQPLRSSCGGSDPAVSQPSFALNAQHDWQQARAQAEAQRAAEANRDYDEAYQRFQGDNLSKWYLAAPMNNCAVTCAAANKRCSKRFFDQSLHETNTYGKISALLMRLKEAGRTVHDGIAGDWYRIADMTAASRAVYSAMNTLGDVTHAVDTESNGRTVVAGGGATPNELAFWPRACRDFEFNDTCTRLDEGTRETYCGKPPLRWSDNTSCWETIWFQNGPVRERAQVPNARRDFPHVWRARGNYRGFFENTTCLRDVQPGTTGNFFDSFFPAVFMANFRGQQPYEIPSCGATDYGDSVPDDYCDTAYFDARWRRGCPCEEEEHPRVETASGLQCANGPRNTSTCMHEGVPDPQCCSRAISATCGAGYKYYTGSPCKWRTHEQWTTTICCPEPTYTTTTTTIGEIAQGWYLGRTGELNCSRVCAEEQRFLNKVTKPAGMYCINDNTRSGRLENISEIVNQIRWRDWQGASVEQNPTQCGEVNTGNSVLNFAPSLRNIGTWQQCKPGWDWYWHGTAISNACDPNPAGWTTANGFNQNAENAWNTVASTYLGPSSVIRRLCKCSATPPTTTTTTTMTIFVPTPCPVGWATQANGAMCTDASNTPWNGGVELRRFRPNALGLCADACGTDQNCNGFVYWAGDQWSGGCRLYTACTHVRYQGSGEYAGSLACQKQVGCPVGWITMGRGAMCTDEANTAWNGGIELRRYRPRSIDTCAAECNANSLCNGYVYWAGDDWSGGCRHYAACTHLRYQDSGEYSGSLACQKAL